MEFSIGCIIEATDHNYQKSILLNCSCNFQFANKYPVSWFQVPFFSGLILTYPDHIYIQVWHGKGRTHHFYNDFIFLFHSKNGRKLYQFSSKKSSIFIPNTNFLWRPTSLAFGCADGGSIRSFFSYHPIIYPTTIRTSNHQSHKDKNSRVKWRGQSVTPANLLSSVPESR